MLKTLPAVLLGLFLFQGELAKAQLTINSGATFFIQSGAVVTVQGDITSNVDIQGPGKVLLKGSATQNINMNGFYIPNLEIDNTANATLTSDCKVSSSLLFTNGKIQLGNFNFALDAVATVTGAADTKFLETNGTGYAQRNIGNAAASNQLVPVGAGTLYAPISLTHAGGTYTAALLGAQAKSGKSPNSHIRVESYTNVYWPVNTSGVTGGTYSGTATYPSDATPGFTGTESDIRGMSFNGTDWSLTGEAHNNATNTISAQLASNTGQVFGMNRFLLMNSKVLLQGASPSAGIMSDALRVAPTVLPTTEPYRSAPYSFSTLNGGVQEVVSPTVFNDLGNNNNIVDWVFVELRNNVTSGSVLLQTRSALVQRDGDIVDIDGTSPLYFKNLDAGDYTVTIRHRNHLPISTNNAAGSYKNLTLSSSTPVLDFTSPATNILGVANTNYAQIGGYNMMYGGNANFNTTVRFNSLNNDKDYILTNVTYGLNNNPGLALSPVYYPTDVNMNKTVRFNSLNNDKDFLLITVLGNDPAAVKTQILPN